MLPPCWRWLAVGRGPTIWAIPAATPPSVVSVRHHNVAHGLRLSNEGLEAFLAAVEVTAQRRAGLPGVWVGERKIAAVGVHVKRWVTLHGLALNVRVNPEHFAMINPCGLRIEVVSLDDLVLRRYSLDEVVSGLLGAMSPLFGWRIIDQVEAEPIGRRP